MSNFCMIHTYISSEFFIERKGKKICDNEAKNAKKEMFKDPDEQTKKTFWQGVNKEKKDKKKIYYEEKEKVVGEGAHEYID